MSTSHTLKKVIKDKETLFAYYTRNWKRVAKTILQSFLFIFIAMVIVGFNIGYPYQLLVCLPFIFLAINYFFKALLIRKTAIKKSVSYSVSLRFIKNHTVFIVLTILLVVVCNVFFSLAPVNKNPYGEIVKNKEVLAFTIKNDTTIAATLMDSFDVQTDELLADGLLEKNELSADERQKLLGEWNSFLQTVSISENITDTSRYFNTISYWHFPQAHAGAYVVAYALYIKKYESFERIIAAARYNPDVLKVFNEYSSVYGGVNSFNGIQALFYDKDSVLKRGLGRVYLSFLERSVLQKENDENTTLLIRESKKAYSHLLGEASDTLLTYPHFIGKSLEGSLFTAWFPVQKNVADTMGKMEVSSRKEEFITREQVAVMRPLLQPGDIFIERRNWHVSNAGIPGFWPHAALYLSNIKTSSAYFQEVFPYQGYATLDDLLKDKYPRFYKAYSTSDTHGDWNEVIEGKAPGIIIQSLEESGGADFLGVMRARLSKQEKLIAVLQAISNYGKPYDYNFDFETKDAIVCSELVYDAYLPRAGNKGVPFTLEITSGRKMVSPNNMVKKFADENGTDHQVLDFVYFFDADEEKGIAYPSTVEAFSESWKRSKFSWNQYNK